MGTYIKACVWIPSYMSNMPVRHVKERTWSHVNVLNTIRKQKGRDRVQLIEELQDLVAITLDVCMCILHLDLDVDEISTQCHMDNIKTSEL